MAKFTAKRGESAHYAATAVWRRESDERLHLARHPQFDVAVSECGVCQPAGDAGPAVLTAKAAVRRADGRARVAAGESGLQPGLPEHDAAAKRWVQSSL